MPLSATLNSAIDSMETVGMKMNVAYFRVEADEVPTAQNFLLPNSSWPIFEEVECYRSLTELIQRVTSSEGYLERLILYHLLAKGAKCYRERETR